MNDDLDRRREQLESLAQKFIRSSGELRRKMINAIKGPEIPSTIFTYLEYLEFNANEFHKFKHMAPISDQDIQSVDWDLLSRQLLT